MAPRPGVEKPAVGKIDLPIHHSDKEWDAVYVHIERLYVHERRKLRHVMETMETEYNFKATCDFLTWTGSTWHEQD